MFELNTTMSVHLGDVEEFILSDDFRDFLLSNTTNFAVAAFILQTLLDRLDEIKEEELEEDEG